MQLQLRDLTSAPETHKSATETVEVNECIAAPEIQETVADVVKQSENTPATESFEPAAGIVSENKQALSPEIQEPTTKVVSVSEHTNETEKGGDMQVGKSSNYRPGTFSTKLIANLRAKTEVAQLAGPGEPSARTGNVTECASTGSRTGNPSTAKQEATVDYVTSFVTNVDNVRTEREIPANTFISLPWAFQPRFLRIRLSPHTFEGEGVNNGFYIALDLGHLAFDLNLLKKSPLSVCNPEDVLKLLNGSQPLCTCRPGHITLAYIPDISEHLFHRLYDKLNNILISFVTESENPGYYRTERIHNMVVREIRAYQEPGNLSSNFKSFPLIRTHPECESDDDEAYQCAQIVKDLESKEWHFNFPGFSNPTVEEQKEYLMKIRARDRARLLAHRLLRTKTRQWIDSTPKTESIGVCQFFVYYHCGKPPNASEQQDYRMLPNSCPPLITLLHELTDAVDWLIAKPLQKEWDAMKHRILAHNKWHVTPLGEVRLFEGDVMSAWENINSEWHASPYFSSSTPGLHEDLEDGKTSLEVEGKYRVNGVNYNLVGYTVPLLQFDDRVGVETHLINRERVYCKPAPSTHPGKDTKREDPCTDKSSNPQVNTCYKRKCSLAVAFTCFHAVTFHFAKITFLAYAETQRCGADAQDQTSKNDLTVDTTDLLAIIEPHPGNEVTRAALDSQADFESTIRAGFYPLLL